MIRSASLSPFRPLLVALCCALMLAPLAGVARAQSVKEYQEFYRSIRINALERIVLSYPSSRPASEPTVYGVRRDSLGRPVAITRFFFGNPDNRADWTTMRISYSELDSLGTLLERRTFHGSGGVPIDVGLAHGEDILFKDGVLTMRRLFDRDEKPLTDVKAVTRVMYRRVEPNLYMQEWFYSNGKQYHGADGEGDLRLFAATTEDGFFRRFTVDDHGNIVREEIWNLEKKPTHFPGGEYIRQYELDSSGLPLVVRYLDRDGEPTMSNDSIASEHFRYDGHGRLVEWRAFNLADDPIARPDGAAAVVFTYREFDGVLISQQKFDAEGKPVQ